MDIVQGLESITATSESFVANEGTMFNSAAASDYQMVGPLVEDHTWETERRRRVEPLGALPPVWRGREIAGGHKAGNHRGAGRPRHDGNTGNNYNHHSRNDRNDRNNRSY